MKFKAIRFLSGFMAALLLSMLCIPAFASSGSTYEQRVGLWDWLTDQNSILPDVIGYVTGTICPRSDDGYHHANSYQKDFQNGYYNCICSYCGRVFDAYESDLQQSYNDYTASLPSVIYDSAGGLSWKIVPDTHSSSSSRFTVEFFDDYVAVKNSSIAGGGIITVSFGLTEDILAPFDGTYFLSPFVLYSESEYAELTLSSFSSGAYRFAGESLFNGKYFFRVRAPAPGPSGYWYGYAILNCIPNGPMLGDTYNTTTRPTGITGGNYGIVGDNGQITTVVDNSSIINETNNTYYNPATGQKDTITNWSYDYSDRSYNVILDSGDTVTVTYGDENITIIEGGITYNIYYITEASADSCEHEWYQTGAVQGNCLTPAQRTYTCYVCGKQYTETDPAPGHSWHIIQEVSTK